MADVFIWSVMKFSLYINISALIVVNSLLWLAKSVNVTLFNILVVTDFFGKKQPGNSNFCTKAIIC